MMKRTALAKLLVVTLASVAVVATGCRSKRPDKNITPIPGTFETDVNSPDGSGGPIGENGAGAGPDLTTGRPGEFPIAPDVRPIDLDNDPRFEDTLSTPANPSMEGIRIDEPVDENAEIWAHNTVNFGFDSSVVRPSEVYKLNEIVSTLVQSPHLGVKVEGHCDERGTEEYNRALGERRANSVRDYLMQSGVGPNQIRTLSYGEDMPADLGHDEAAWAANRRAVFVLLTPKR